jgi:hypothetical protein
MTNGPENRLIEALKNAEVHGDIAPRSRSYPMTMVLRKNTIQANLMKAP